MKTRILLLIPLLFFVSLTYAAEKSSLLRDARYYVQQGFLPEYLSSDPALVTWQLVQFTNENVRISYTQSGPLTSLPSTGNYTAAVTFITALSELERHSIWLLVSSIGQNYEIYLNGRLIHREMYTDREGNIIADRTAKDARFLLPVQFFNNGRNFLVFHITGENNRRDTGVVDPEIVLLPEGSSPEEPPRYGHLLAGISLCFLFFAVLIICFCRKRDFLVSLLWILAASALIFTKQYGRILFFDARSAQSLAVVLQCVTAVLAVLLFELRSLRRSLVPPLLAALCMSIVFAFSFEYYDTVAALLANFLLSFIAVCAAASFITLFSIPRGNTTAPLGRLLAAYLGGTLMYYLLPLAGYENDWALLVLPCAVFLILAAEQLQVLSKQESIRLISEANYTDAQRELELARNELKESLVRIDRLTEKSAHYEQEYKKYRDNFLKDSYITGVVQNYAFSRYAPSDERYEIAMFNSSQGKVSQIFYDFYERGDRVIGLSLFSVDATGISSGLITLLARNTLFRRFNQYHDKKLSEIVTAANKDIADEIGRFNNPLTGTMLKFSDDSIEYVSIGFPDCVYRNANRRTRTVRLLEREMAKSFGVSVPDDPFAVIRFVLEKGDSLLLYTPSMSANRSADDQPYSNEMVISAFEQIPHFPNAIDEVNHFVKQYNSYIDTTVAADFALIVIRKK